MNIFFGQVPYGHLLVPGQVENYTISTPLLVETQMTMLQNGQHIRVLTVSYQIAKKKKEMQWPVSGNPLLCAINRTLNIRQLDFYSSQS